MEKIDYGDINKFLVSIGIVLIGLSVLTPFLYLKEDFGIYLSEEEISKYEQPIKSLIIDKQFQVIKIQKIIPFISIILLFLGLSSTSVGLYRWFQRQSKIDEKFDKEIQKLDLEIESLTPEEKIEKAKQEVQEIELAEQLESIQTVNKTVRTNSRYLDYMNIEQALYKSFQNLKNPNFEVFTEQKLGNRFYIDLLLKAKSKKFADRIIEIKYFKKHLPLSTVNQALHQLNTYVSYYKENANKAVVPVLLIVYNNENIKPENILFFKTKIVDFSSDLPNMNRLKVEFIDENTLDKFDVGNLLKR